MNFTDDLLQLGLNKNEAAVYLALLKLGVTQAGPVVKETKLHRMLVYNALESLVEKGLATVLHKKNVKLFHANDPTALSDRQKRFYELAQGLTPSLRELQQKSADPVQVRTLIGTEGFRTNLQEVVESAAHQKDRLMRIIGSGHDTDFYETIGEWYPKYKALLEQHEVKKRLLAPASFSAVFKQKFVAEKGTELRTMPSDVSSPTYTRITEEMVAIEIYRPQVVVIQIRNQAIARDYIESFDLLWNRVK